MRIGARAEDRVEQPLGRLDGVLVPQPLGDLRAREPGDAELERGEQRSADRQAPAAPLDLVLDRGQDRPRAGRQLLGHYAGPVNPFWLWVQGAIMFFVLVGAVIAVVKLV